MAFALLLTAAAVWLLVLSWGPLHNLFQEDPDNERWTYLLFGLPFVAVAVGCVALAVRLLRR